MSIKLDNILEALDKKDREGLLAYLAIKPGQKGYISSRRLAAILTNNGYPISDKTIGQARYGY